MTRNDLYSIRMRASAGDRHVSGAERIVSSDKIDSTVQKLVARAREKSTTFEHIVVNIESLRHMTIHTLTALDVVTLNAPDMSSGRSVAAQVLRIAGVSLPASEAAIHQLSKGTAPSGGAMRGAMIMDFLSGERFEPDQERGIRASRFDWSEDALEKINRCLAAVGLTHFRTREALSLATKVAHAPGMVAELCWSDEPDYTAGYVASLRTGYVRFPFLKQKGNASGGRAFFVDRNRLDMGALVRYLETDVVLINEIGECLPAREPDIYFVQR